MMVWTIHSEMFSRWFSTMKVCLVGCDMPPTDVGTIIRIFLQGRGAWSVNRAVQTSRKISVVDMLVFRLKTLSC